MANKKLEKIVKSNATFTVPCNWDEELISVVKKFPVHSLYGKLRSDVVGGGRAPYRLRDVDRQFAKEYITELAKQGIYFNYLLNTSCMGNQEFTTEFRKKLAEFIEWIEESGAAAVTVALPSLASFVAKNFPSLEVNVSKMSKVDTVKKAKFWESLGAVSANMDHNLIRNFKAIKLLASNSNLDFHLLVNDACLYSCPWDMYHNLTESHASNDNKSSYVSYCTFNCREKFTDNPAEIIRSMFIRPEDIDFYVELGVKKFKLIDRLKPTSWIENALSAYANRRYDGNLADLFGLFSTFDQELAETKALKDSDVKTLKQIQKLRTGEAFMTRFYIDNRALDGFLEHFKTNSCSEQVCDVTCGYCESVAKKTITYNHKERDIALQNLKKVLHKLNSFQT